MTKRLPAPKRWLTSLLKEGGLHSPLGPSSGERWFNCPGSHKWTAGMPDTESEFAAEGTFAHAVSEYCRIFEVPVSDLRGVTVKYPKGEKWEFTVDEEMVDALQGFIDRASAFDGDAFCEEIVHYTKWVENGWGTADDFRINEEIKTFKITDLKYGKGVLVPVEGNIQQMLYALGIYQDYAAIYGIDSSWNIILCVDQPRLNYYAEWSINVGVLVDWADEIVTARALEAYSDDAVFKSDIGQTDGHGWCQFCRGRKTCRTRAMDALNVNIEQQDISLDDLAEILPKLSDIEAFCKDMRARAHQAILDGQVVQAQGQKPWKLVRGRRDRVWNDKEAFVDEMTEAYSVPKEELFEEPKLISVKQMEDKNIIDKDALKSYYTYTKGNLLLAPGTDRRESEAMNAETEFSD